MDWSEILRNAIVKQAADDYVKASAIIQIGKMKRQRLYKKSDLIKAERLKEDCVTFFKSKWARVLIVLVAVTYCIGHIVEKINKK